MKRMALSLVLAVLGAFIIGGAALAQPAPEFKLGFKALADQIPDVVGVALEDEQPQPNGDSIQRTANGILVWRKADNWTAFTNGDRTWINGPAGLQERANADRFPWEAAPAVAPAPAPADGWKVYERIADGFSIALPPSWVELPMDSQTMEAVLGKVSEQNPDYAASLRDQAAGMARSGIKFFAFDMSPELLATGFATNLNVIKQPMGMPVSVEFMARMTMAMLESSEGTVKPVTYRNLALDGGEEAGELKYGVQMKDDQGKVVTLAITQYLAMKGGDLYVVSLGTTPDEAAKYTPIFEKIGKSLTIK